MRILLATETLHAGGAETFVVRLANALSGEHDVAIVVYYKNIVNPGVIAQLSPKVKTFFIDIGNLSLKHKLDSLSRKMGIDFSFVQDALLKGLKNVIDTFRPDVVHAHLFKADYVVARLKKSGRYSFKQVTTIHGDYSSFYNKEADARMLNIQSKMQETLSEIDHIVCLCEEHRLFFQTHYPETSEKLALIYNGYVPVSETYKSKSKTDLGLPQDKFLFGMVSRGVEKKGWKKAIDAFINANISQASLVLVGNGDYLDKLAREIQHPDIIFSGFSSTPVEYIQHFDVCLLPTLFHYESLPTVVMEYLYCGKPVIATNVGEIGKMIATPDDHQAGDLLDFTNFDVKEEALSQYMARYYSDTAYLDQKRAYTSAAFEKFDMKRCADGYILLYQAIK